MLECSADDITFGLFFNYIVVHKYPHIPKEIHHVNFTNLSRLHIGENHIENIEPLCSM
jgi:hypothetical protein